MTADADKYAENVRRFTGFASDYDRHRPSPPDILAGLVARFAGHPRPSLVVDLGSGTGLSTRYWADKAERVIGVEPTADMRNQAAGTTTSSSVSYQEGFSHATGLPAASARVVCCMQALHWMEPAATFAEAARILAPGGVFVACDYDWPPASGAWEADAAFAHCIQLGRKLEADRVFTSRLQHWPKDGHFARMQASGVFRHVRDLAVHHVDSGSAARLVGLLLSQGYIVSLLRAGIGEDELGITQLRSVAQHTLGGETRPFFWTARVRIGVV